MTSSVLALFIMKNQSEDGQIPRESELNMEEISEESRSGTPFSIGADSRVELHDMD